MESRHKRRGRISRIAPSSTLTPDYSSVLRAAIDSAGSTPAPSVPETVGSQTTEPQSELDTLRTALTKEKRKSRKLVERLNVQRAIIGRIRAGIASLGADLKPSETTIPVKPRKF